MDDGMRVVICDDHHLLVQAMATALGGLGYLVEAAVTTPSDAVRAVATYDPDVLLLDLSFPAGSGLDAARQVIAEHPRTRVLVMTGSDSPETQRVALGLGVAGYVRKAQRIEAVTRALESVMDGRVVVDQALLNGDRGNGASVPRQRTGLDDLTPREQDVLSLLVRGRSTNEIVEDLCVSPSTVRTHVQSIFVKLGVHSRLQAVAMLTQQGLLDPLDGFDVPRH
jgi:DNA-binding NarL/FixJ family response regulator